MSKPSAAKFVDWTQLDLSFVSILAGCTMSAFLVGPRMAPFLLASLTLCVLVAGSRLYVRTAFDRVPSPIFVLFALAGWALLAIGWSAAPAEAFGKVMLLVAFIICAGTISAAAPLLPDRAIGRVARGAVIGFALGLAFLLFEELTGHTIKRLLFGLLPSVRPSSKHVTVIESDAGGEVAAFAAYLTNRNMAALSLALWPTLLMIWCLTGMNGRWFAGLAVLAVAATTIGLSQHDTSVVALFGAGAAFSVVRWKPNIGFGVVVGGWLVATLLVVPITDWGFRAMRLHEVTWLPHTARQRVILWGYTAEQVKQRPFLGVGTDATKPLDARRGPQVETPPGFVYQWRSGPHAHNVFLQTWYELGAPGAALLCLFGLALLRTLHKLANPASAFLVAAFVGATITAAFSWGLWQSWFMGAFALSTALGILAHEVARRTSSLNRSEANRSEVAGGSNS